MKRLLFLMFFLAFAAVVTPIQPQEYRTISGFVKESEFLDVLGGVTVSAGTAVTQTDMTGYFILNVPAGIYTVKAEVTGYETTSVMVDVTMSDVQITIIMEKEKEQPEFPDFTGYDVEFEFETVYIPARVVVQFVYTENFSIANVVTVGNSLWTATTSPVGIDFNAKDVDTYEFDVMLKYAEETDQIVQVGIWSGSFAPNTIPIHFSKRAVYLHFRLVCTEQPRAPTATEVAEQVQMLTHQDLEYYMDQVTILTRQFEENLLVQWIIVAAAIIFGVLTLIVSVYTLRTKAGD